MEGAIDVFIPLNLSCLHESMRNLIHLVSDGYNSWDLSTKIAVVTFLILGVGLIYKGIRWILNLLNRKRFESRVDTESYPMEVIENSTRYYIRSDCSSVDPNQESEIRHLIATTEDLFRYIDKFRAGPMTSRHLLVLADSGMGKTSFVLNYFHSRAIRIRWKKKKLAIVYLGTKQSLGQIRAIQDQRSTDIILDAFDEDTEAIENYQSRMAELLGECQLFRRVIITCRTQFFPKAAEIPVETGIVRVEPRAAGSPGEYELYKVYLAPLTDKQINQYLIKRFGRFRIHKRRRARSVVDRIPLLSVRPMILSYIPDLIDTDEPIDTALKLYNVLVERWLERESHWVDRDQLRRFSEELAIDLFIKRKERGAERIPKSELVQVARKVGVDLEDWKLTGRSLLNRDAMGNYKFAHRSIMEYLLIKTFTQGRDEIRSQRWTDMMKSFYIEHLKANSHYFSNSFMRNDDDLMERFDGVDLSELDVSALASTLQMYCSLRNANLEGAWLVGMDLTSSILTRAALRNSNLSRAKFITTDMREADMSNANLTKTNFTNSNLTSCKLNGAILTSTKFMRTDLSHADFQSAEIEDTDFWEANLTGADLRGVDLRRARGLDLNQLKQARTDSETQVPTSAITESEFKERMKNRNRPDYDPYEE